MILITYAVQILGEEIVKTLKLSSPQERKHPPWPKTLQHLQGAEHLGVLLLFMEHNDMVMYLIPLDKLQTISKSGSMHIL